jgi:hypothetical protein
LTYYTDIPVGSGCPYLINNLEQVYILRYSKKTKSPI